jgi:hypothetical protein
MTSADRIDKQNAPIRLYACLLSAFSHRAADLKIVFGGCSW